jgi:hypothetical protein
MGRRGAIEVILLSAWLGAALLVAAVVAPAAFRMLPSRAMAGTVIGPILTVIFASGLFIAIIALGLEARMTRYTLGFSVTAPFAAMIIGCAVAQFVISPKIDSVRAEMGGAVDTLDATDPRRVRFGKLHGLSVLCMGVAMVGAGSALGLKIYHSKT